VIPPLKGILCSSVNVLRKGVYIVCNVNGCGVCEGDVV
jgi:hypothetical protein